MPLNLPSPEPLDGDLFPVVLFPNLGEGFGHGITDQGFLTRSGFALPEGYDRTINMTVSGDGAVFSPSYNIHYRKSPYYGATQTPRYPPSFLIPWETSVFSPTVLFALFISAWKFENGAAAAETDATNETYAGATFHDHDGTAYLYAGEFSTTTGAPQLLNRRTQAGTWTRDGDVNAKYLVSAAGALWRSTSDYEVSKCPAGSDPFTIGSWGASFRVGTSDSKITAIGAIGASPVIFKEDGIYFFEEADSRFECKFKVTKNPLNFAFVSPNGANGLLTTTANGDFVDVQQFGAIVVDSPLKYAMDRDTPMGRIEHMISDGRYIYALLAPGAKRSQPSGMKILTTANTTDYTSPGTFTDVTSTLTDGSMATTVDFGAIDTLANGDGVLIGFDTPFLAMEFINAGGGTAVVDHVHTVAAHISTGPGTFAAVTIVDGTNHYSDATSNAYSFATTGVIAITPDSSISAWTTATYNSQTKYWLRLTFSVVANGTIPIGEVFIIPQRAAPNFTTTNFDQAEVWEATGMLVKVLRWDRVKDVWDDIYTLPAVGTASRSVHRSPGSNKLAISHAGTPNSPEGSLIVATRDEFVQIPLPANTTSPVVYEPRLARDASGQIAPVLYPSAVNLPGPCELAYIEVYANNMVENSDSVTVAMRMDDTRPWIVTEAGKSDYSKFSFSRNNIGSVLHTAIQMNDAAATNPIGPSGRIVVAWLRESKNASLQEPRTTIEVS